MNEFLELEEQVLRMIKTVYDPEIPVNIYDLGLIYDIDVDPEFNVRITMTLTAPDCPEAQYMMNDVRELSTHITGVKSVDVILTFDPPWSFESLSEEVKLELGFL